MTPRSLVVAGLAALGLAAGWATGTPASTSTGAPADLPVVPVAFQVVTPQPAGNFIPPAPAPPPDHRWHPPVRHHWHPPVHHRWYPPVHHWHPPIHHWHPPVHHPFPPDHGLPPRGPGHVLPPHPGH